MAEEIIPPFSVRNRGAHAQVDNECPETTRIGLLHILCRLVEQRYLKDWNGVVSELRRIARARPDYLGGEEDYLRVAEVLLLELAWDKVFDFCERLHGRLAEDVTQHNFISDETEVLIQRSQAQQQIAGELQSLFLEENLAFEFSNGLVRRRGRRNTTDQLARADRVLGDSRLSSARFHFNKALKYFRNVAQPDYENVVKEAVCAVEAAARALFPSGGSTLGDVVKSITGTESGQLPKSLANTFHGLYGFSSGGQGVRHGGAKGGAATREIAEYALAIGASQIVLLMDLATAGESDIPF